MAKIFVFRHAQTTDNVAHIFSGKRDPDLTEEGVREAENIRDQLNDEKVTKAYCSDKLRSRKTLEIVLETHPGIVPIIDSRINERDYGDLTGKNKDEVAKEFPDKYPLWHRSYNIAPPNGESIQDVEKRVIPFLDELKNNLKPDDVVFISVSANSLRPIRKYFENLSIEEMCSFEHPPAKVYEYEI
jgi:2,3-bisphosphoglycerate-dependent phosphoglycerate mutase